MPGLDHQTESSVPGRASRANRYGRQKPGATVAGRPRRMTECRPRYLFDEWPRLAGYLRVARQVVLFLDFDGTLAPVVADPQKVWLDPAARATLRRLARKLPVFVISGRRAADVQKRVGVPGIEYLGLHGSERAGARSKVSGSAGLISRVRRLVMKRLGNMPTIRIEDKGPIFAVHYRGAARDTVHRAEAALREILAPFNAGLRITRGKSAWEVLPKDFGDKGAAVRKLISHFPGGTLPIYAGDDVSDEAAFAVLDGGLTVVVGRNSHTRARYYVCNPREVARLLTELEAATA